jgi:hypothetical protein
LRGVELATNTDTIATLHVAIVTPILRDSHDFGGEIGTLAWISRLKLGTPKLEIQKWLDHFDS